MLVGGSTSWCSSGYCGSVVLFSRIVFTTVVSGDCIQGWKYRWKFWTIRWGVIGVWTIRWSVIGVWTIRWSVIGVWSLGCWTSNAKVMARVPYFGEGVRVGGPIEYSAERKREQVEMVGVMVRVVG